MAEKPIFFNTEMVQAILDGRKTMTRRVIKADDDPENWKISIAGTSVVRTPLYDVRLSRYEAGDILWVCETWAKISDWSDVCPETGIFDGYIYKADWPSSGEHPKWRPPIFMPREAARIFLRVTDVRVERLQEILCGDMKREGCIPPTVTGGQYQQWQRDYWIPLWDSTIKKQDISRYGWDANPWVWVISFERRENHGR